MDDVLSFAQELLERHDEFFPFGAYLDVRGGLSVAEGEYEYGELFASRPHGLNPGA